MNSFNVKFETEPCPKYIWFMAFILLILTLDHISIQHGGSFCLFCPPISFVFLIRRKCRVFTFPYMNTHRQITSARVPTWTLYFFMHFHSRLSHSLLTIEELGALGSIPKHVILSVTLSVTLHITILVRFSFRWQKPFYPV